MIKNFNELTRRVQKLNFGIFGNFWTIEPKNTDNQKDIKTIDTNLIISLGRIKNMELETSRTIIRQKFPNFTENSNFDIYNGYSCEYINNKLEKVHFNSNVTYINYMNRTELIKGLLKEATEYEEPIREDGLIYFPLHGVYADNEKNPTEVVIYNPDHYIRKTQTLCIVPSNNKPGLFDSKIGGIPYWDFSEPFEYPTMDDRPLFLICQINLDREKINDPRLPKTGILQFFIDEENLGTDYNSMSEKQNTQIIYHPKVNYSITEKELLQNGIPSPIGHTYQDISDGLPYKKSKGIKLVGKFLRHSDTPVNNLFGYPLFEQGNPLDYKNIPGMEYVLLLQLGSTDDLGMMWGDGGTAQFFIMPNDLANKKFDSYIYDAACS